MPNYLRTEIGIRIEFGESSGTRNKTHLTVLFLNSQCENWDSEPGILLGFLTV